MRTRPDTVIRCSSAVCWACSKPGVIEGDWRRKDADAAGRLINHRYRISRVGDVLLRGNDVALWKAPTSRHTSASAASASISSDERSVSALRRRPVECDD
jgi:hypothetical protein